MKYIYVRVSTDKQDNETQIELLKRHAPDATVYQDKISGCSQKPALGSLRSVLKRGDTLYLYKYDRLSRSLLESLELISEFKSMGVDVISVTQPLDTRTTSGMAMFQMSQVFAEMERNLISDRTKARLAFLKSQGKRLGGKREGAGRKPNPLSDAERLFLKELREKGQVDWTKAALDFKARFGKEYKPNTLRRKA